MEISAGTLLGGRVTYLQPRCGFRSGIEPVLLAAAVPAKPAEKVLEVGSGAGAGLFCLAARVAGINGVGVEQDLRQVAIARQNATLNGYDGLDFIEADFLAWRGQARFDHSFSNPPYHRGGTPSPLASRERAKRADDALLARWVAAMAHNTRPGGSITVSVPVTTLEEIAHAYRQAGIGRLVVFPLWKRAGAQAKLMLVQGICGSRANLSIATGLCLHESGGAYTAQTEAILRSAAPLLLVD